MDSDQRQAIKFLREYLGRPLKPFEFQKQPYDHVLRREDLEKDAFLAVAYYIVENPVRAGIVEKASAYPYSGAILPGFPRLDIHSSGYRDLFWRTHASLLKKNGYQG